MSESPIFDLGSPPNAADGKVCFGWREVVVGPNQLVHALPRDPQNLGYLGHADEIEGHAAKLRETLAQMQ